MRPSTGWKRLWLREQARQAEASTVEGWTLRLQLESHLEGAVAAVGVGQAIASTSANGHSTTFSAPGSGTMGAEAYGAMVDEMLSRYDQAAATLAADGVDSPTDAQLLARMLAALQPIRSITTSYRTLRC